MKVALPENAQNRPDGEVANEIVKRKYGLKMWREKVDWVKC